ncbi:MAG: B12-binding domain-containing radical SAM protein [Candidatus Omnitrophica bacterium]|nr:B12-binding domain-containing radical SAM protein [Candidatus Omnitrophota bacterium]
MSSSTNIKIALIFPSYRSVEDPVSLKETKEHLGIIPPLSLAYVAAILEKAGCLVELIDASALNLTKDQVVDKVNKFNPNFLGFTSTTIDFQHTLEWINYLKKKTNIPIIIGGIHLSVYPKETLTHRAIDYGVIGEAEETLPQLLEHLINKKGLNNVKGICYRENNHIVVTEKRPPTQDLDNCPFPARHLIPNEKYYSFISKKKNFTAMLTSRGCPYKCIFCDNQTILYRYRSPKNVVDEMEQCYNLFKIKEIDIFDALFSVDPNRVIEICREIKRRKLEISWSFRTRVDLVTANMLDELKEAGCIRIYYGIESGDLTILKNINKKINIDTVKRVISLTKEKRIGTFGYFMIGNIGETEDTIKKTLDLMLQLPLDYVQISPVFAPPNTALYESLKKKINRDYWQDYTLNLTKQDLLPLYGTDLTQKEIKRYVRKCYLRFYLGFSYIIKTLFKLSYSEFIRSIKALKDMIFYYCLD